MSKEPQRPSSQTVGNTKELRYDTTGDINAGN